MTPPLPPTATLGILGGGQLGRMLALAAARLGFDVAILTPEADSPASRVAAHTLVADYADEKALAALAKLCAIVTFEFENVPAAVVAGLQAAGAEVAPGPKALAIAQDRLLEKSFLNQIGVPTVGFHQVDTVTDLTAGLDLLGAPALLKTRRQGYDGKGQVWVRTVSEAEAALQSLGGGDCILEARAAFTREVSIIAVRNRSGAFAAYPLAENVHENGVLRVSTVPANVAPETETAALGMARKLVEGLDYVGVIGVEMFDMGDGRLWVNEFAPRVHNTGHWTLDACQVDQFEQHIRAIANWPLGPTTPFAAAEMTNLLGAEVETWAKLAAEPDARLWLYGKRDAKPGRKMGHVTRLKGRFPTPRGT